MTSESELRSPISGRNSEAAAAFGPAMRDPLGTLLQRGSRAQRPQTRPNLAAPKLIVKDVLCVHADPRLHRLDL